ncbi:MAG: hypothetical protein BAA04_04605 [Firmicutes bacterium ZCTH02-B6]|nr:MAG: hypothetical protein BAA04_04605 [Firmicutes bacterium ZCTH02-B6]
MGVAATGPVFHPDELEQWAAAASQDTAFQRMSRGLETRFLLASGREAHLLSLKDGHLTVLGRPAPDDSWDFALRGPDESWRRLLSPVPPPGYQSLTALRAIDPGFAWEGNLLRLSQALAALERWVELARWHKGKANGSLAGVPPAAEQSASEQPAGSASREVAAGWGSPVLRDPGQITGKYRDLPGPDGRSSRIYYEEAGQGIPLLMLHTAGADSRQYHALLADVELARDWHMYAFDLPYHGRSEPPDGWWREPYRLTAEAYAHWCLTFIREVIGQPAVVMGCSMGGAMAVYLAARHRDHVRAAIGLQAPDRSPGRITRFLAHAQVNQAVHNPTWTYGLMSPTSPEFHRRRSWWLYSQGGWGVYEGDLHFYSREWDGAAIGPEVDTEHCPVYLLTGEYDYSASPTSTRRLAGRIRGCRFRVMPGLGHFPMTEAPDQFREHLLLVLRELQTDIEGKWREV